MAMTRTRSLRQSTAKKRPAPSVSESAGGVVLNGLGEVLVVNQNNDSWSLPKGHVDPGESAREAAEREIYEESGVSRLRFVRALGSYERPRIGKGGGNDRSEIKRITLFLYTTAQKSLRPLDPRNPEARWVPRSKVAALLTHAKDKAFFRGLLKALPKGNENG